MTSQLRAETLLSEWRRLRSSGACAFVLDIQEHKDRLEQLASVLNLELYCSAEDSNFDDKCNQFEQELNRFKQQIYQDLLAGLQKSNAK